jgi:hypothetical protein
MPAAVLVVHQLRYELAFGADSSEALSAQGHAYLGSLVPWIVLLAGLSLGATVGRLAHRWAGGSGRRSGRIAFVRVWLVVAATLFAIYSGQELLEGTFASGHLAGLAAVFGAGGWWAVPAALLVGGVLALALGGAHAVEEALDARRISLPILARGDELVGRSAAMSWLVRVAPLARVGAGRAPPRRLAAVV